MLFARVRFTGIVSIVFLQLTCQVVPQELARPVATSREGVSVNPGGGIAPGGYCLSGTSPGYGGGPELSPCLSTGCPGGFVCLVNYQHCVIAAVTDCPEGCPAGTVCERGTGCAPRTCDIHRPCRGGQSMQCNLKSNLCEFRPGVTRPQPPGLSAGDCQERSCPRGMGCDENGWCSCTAVHGGLTAGSRLVGQECQADSECDARGGPSVAHMPTICQEEQKGGASCQVPCSILDDPAAYCMQFGMSAALVPYRCHIRGRCGPACLSDEQCQEKGWGEKCLSSGECDGKTLSFGIWSRTAKRYDRDIHLSATISDGAQKPEVCALDAELAGKWVEPEKACECTVLGDGGNRCHCVSYRLSAGGSYESRHCLFIESRQEPEVCSCDRGKFSLSCSGVLKLTSTCLKNQEPRLLNLRRGRDGLMALDGDLLLPSTAHPCDQGCP
ncbi:MAG: hypothetical protein HS115_12825 [Spirochaetales bacterium]|nr:hypothetical protein [Spirochaetales bacterium]